MCESTFLAVPWKITGDNWSCVCELMYFVLAGFWLVFPEVFSPKGVFPLVFPLADVGHTRLNQLSLYIGPQLLFVFVLLRHMCLKLLFYHLFNVVCFFVVFFVYSLITFFIA